MASNRRTGARWPYRSGLAPAPPTEASAELLGHSDDDALDSPACSGLSRWALRSWRRRWNRSRRLRATCSKAESSCSRRSSTTAEWWCIRHSWTRAGSSYSRLCSFRSSSRRLIPSSCRHSCFRRSSHRRSYHPCRCPTFRLRWSSGPADPAPATRCCCCSRRHRGPQRGARRSRERLGR
jgi:hypothetical protein